MAGAFDSAAFSTSAFSVDAFDFGTAPVVLPTFVPPQGPGQRFSYWTPVKARDWKERKRKPEPDPVVVTAPPREADAPLSPDQVAFLFHAFSQFDG